MRGGGLCQHCPHFMSDMYNNSSSCMYPFIASLVFWFTVPFPIVANNVRSLSIHNMNDCAISPATFVQSNEIDRPISNENGHSFMYPVVEYTVYI